MEEAEPLSPSGWLGRRGHPEAGQALREWAPNWMHSLEKENGRHLVIRDHTDWGTHESGVA